MSSHGRSHTIEAWYKKMKVEASETIIENFHQNTTAYHQGIDTQGKRLGLFYSDTAWVQPFYIFEHLYALLRTCVVHRVLSISCVVSMQRRI